VGNVAVIGRKVGSYKAPVGTHEGYHSENLSVDGMIILKMTLK